MFLRRTSAYSELRDHLGQANHLLITILVGIEGVRTGTVKKSDDFHATWNPKSIEESARRSRRFVRDAMLNHIVDSLGIYLSLLREPPFDVALSGLSSTNDRSLKPRLDEFCSDLKLQNSLKLALVHLAIQWRNRRLHTGALNAIEKQYVTVLRAAKDDVHDQFCGLDVEDLLGRFDKSESPRFKEVASLVKGTLDFAQMADAVLVQCLDPTYVARYVIGSVLRDRVAMNRRRAGQQWGNSLDDRQRRLKGILTTAGFSDKADAEGCPRLPDDFIDNLARFSFREIADEFGVKLGSS